MATDELVKPFSVQPARRPTKWVLQHLGHNIHHKKIFKSTILGVRNSSEKKSMM
ncbi:hypothetical protein HPP92_009470 [Vanilla planifolia]|uniref:Uncharacterized protein n=1 Tax=Vanilla planifolia TaxID=51239 RepID=A0A835V881_VANPL|nr:hypothetical protein HPP92_009470 [Vanilla planifolia]